MSTVINAINEPDLGRLGRREPARSTATPPTTTPVTAMIRLTNARPPGWALTVVVRQRSYSQARSSASRFRPGRRRRRTGDPQRRGSDAASAALRDACTELSAPLIEVHISNVFAREEFRHHSYLSPIATGVIAGLGVQGYLLALRYLASASRLRVDPVSGCGF